MRWGFGRSLDGEEALNDGIQLVSSLADTTHSICLGEARVFCSYTFGDD
jgi:hypothetical protein